ncbi:bifunctional diguanylate cyclase/phosphodiesterase [Butyrivibrio sp. NC3005]|uniref:bifunctional diguanylate cyclase/phosphodiesterase n=1 Tax=Butyrivibrio sp. NC3005 TaxID=1280685 RepID=UPI000407416E|nr:bifunctional diguanylate cyclase/phosphodiesterase [Butyrivibrio sp. NC3005]
MEKEYTPERVRMTMQTLRPLYDIVRLVDPEECRVIIIDDDNQIHTGEACHSVWNSHNRCSNCTSLKAVRTFSTVERTENYHGRKFQIHSTPIMLSLPDDVHLPCVMEMITIQSTVSEEPKISLPEKENENVLYLLFHDQMTGLPNYEGFLFQARHLLESHKDDSGVMILLNIRGFQSINTFLGREKGNEILVFIADLLKNAFPEDAVIGHVYGDRFAICVPSRMFDEDCIADIILQSTNQIHDLARPITLHFGLYRITDHSLPIPFMLDQATMAMERIHQNIVSGFSWFDQTLMHKISRREKTVQSFERALEEHEFQIYLQPRLDTSSNAIGAEVLTRWILPDGDVVKPDSFIDILEESVLIARFDTYIWEESAKLLKKWQDMGRRDLHLSIHVSSRDFLYLDIPRFFFELSRKHLIDASKLHIEIPETAIGDHGNLLAGNIVQLRSFGFKVFIDRFGVGQSSLKMIDQIEADGICLDRSFIAESEKRKRTKIILSSIVKMCEELGVTVIAKGIETSETYEHLTDIGVPYFQGLLFNKPMPKEEFEEKYMLQANKNTAPVF